MQVGRVQGTPRRRGAVQAGAQPRHLLQDQRIVPGHTGIISPQKTAQVCYLWAPTHTLWLSETVRQIL